MEYKDEFFYLTTTGWKSGSPHEIEIWFVALNGAYFLISEKADNAHWVQNIRRNQGVSFRVEGGRYRGQARFIEREQEPQLAAEVCALMDEKYSWSSGLIVELTSL